MTMDLLDLCYDVLIRILEEVEPEDLAACAQTCRSFNDFIANNVRLYKTHYMEKYDEPRRRPEHAEPDWIPLLQTLVKCRKLLQSSNSQTKLNHLTFVNTTIASLVGTATTKNGVSLSRNTLTELLPKHKNLEVFLHRSSHYDRAGTDEQTQADEEHDRQLSAKLHCLYGIPADAAGRRVLSTHAHARSRVYDLRNYTDNTQWGPFRDDGSGHVDWEMLESIMIIVGYNSGTCCRRFSQGFTPPWTEPFLGVIPDRNQILPSYPSTLPNEPNISLEMKDPFGVSGIWSRIVCFLDYNDLHQYNFSPTAMKHPAHLPRNPLETDEAIRHILMRLQVTEVESPGEFDNQELPIVHFSGTSKSVDVSWDPNANSKIRGTVSLTHEGEVRWTTVSVFFGEERWRSEGIQVGGLRSKRGVVGTWFDKDFDPHGPAGPTAFWKVCDRVFVDDEDDSDDDEEFLWN